MSTSCSRETPISYMEPDGPNVLWELYPRKESDGGFHHGADISLLSQFPCEKEVLFPPGTLLSVLVRPTDNRDYLLHSGRPQRERSSSEPSAYQPNVIDESEQATEYSSLRPHMLQRETGKSFVAIAVRPTFI